MIKDCLSIIIPYWNSKDITKLLLAELLRQKEEFPQTEIIVVDDCSYGQFLDEIDGITVIHNKKNLGCAGSRNVGLNNANGEYIAFCDSDDMVVPEYLSMIYRKMRKGFEWVSWDWRFNNGEQSRQYTPGYRNNAVWAYTYRKDFIGDKRFVHSPVGADDIDFIKRVIDFNVKHYDDPRVLYIYYWYGNENSILHRVLRGERM